MVDGCGELFVGIWSESGIIVGLTDGGSVGSKVAVDCWRKALDHDGFPDDLSSSFKAPFAQKYCPSPTARRVLDANTPFRFRGAEV